MCESDSRLRGEGRGEGASPQALALRIVEGPPHPPRTDLGLARDRHF